MTPSTSTGRCGARRHRLRKGPCSCQAASIRCRMPTVTESPVFNRGLSKTVHKSQRRKTIKVMKVFSERTKLAPLRTPSFRKKTDSAERGRGGRKYHTPSFIAAVPKKSPADIFWEGFQFPPAFKQAYRLAVQLLYLSFYLLSAITRCCCRMRPPVDLFKCRLKLMQKHI